MNVRIVAALAAAVALTGCFSYQPMEIQELEPGLTVRAYLSRDQAVELQETAGIQGRQVEGRVVSADGGQITLEVPSATVSTGAVTRRLKQRVAVPRAGLLEVERRGIDGWKTGLVTGAVTAAAIAVVVYSFQTEDNSPVQDGRDPPDAARIPLLRIPIGH